MLDHSVVLTRENRLLAVAVLEVVVGIAGLR